MNTQHSANRIFRRMFSSILSIVVLLAMAFPAMSAYAQDVPPPTVGLIATTAGINDDSFNEMAYLGLQRAAADLEIEISIYEPLDQSEYDSLMQQCADENELCLVVGFEFRFSLPIIARDNPGTMWGIIDWSYPDCWEGAVEGVDCGSFTEIPNVRGLRFNEKQAGYLAGVLAGGMTVSDAVGAVGGMEIPPVVAFVEGYRNGAQCTNPAVNVLTTYTGTFSDPDLGATTAQDMIAQGADVIFGAAGLTGDGAILYSAQNSQWAIGVDADQYLTVFGNGTVPGSNKLLSSAMKRVDNAVYQTTADFVNGAFTSGTVLYDLATDGVGLAPFHEVEVPKRVKKELATVMQGIIDGTININDPCSLPFVGDWRAIDIDGGDIRLAIGGSPTGPFRIIWTESYFGFCGGEAGIARGVGWINPEDPYLLEADLHLTCFTTGDQVDFHPVWRFNPATGWLTSRDDDYGGFVTTWHRPGVSLPLMWQQIIAHPDENWVEGMGFPEGTIVSLLIRDSEGNRLFQGTAEAFRPEWDPNNTTVQFFLDFDLKAGDHLWMSDGMVVKELVVTNLQITMINLAEKTVSGVATPGSEVIIEYFPEEADPVMFSVFADQDGFWTAIVEDMTFGLPGLASEPDADNDLTRVVFHTNAQIVASESGNWFWTTGFNPGTLDLFIYASADAGAELLWSGQRVADAGGFVIVDDHGLDLVTGNYVVVSDGVTRKGLDLQPISVKMFDTQYEIMAGFAPVGSEVWAAAGPQERQERIRVQADPVTGEWLADFKTIGFDITEDMRPWSYATVYDGDGDANEGSTPPPLPNLNIIANQADWVDTGITVGAGQSFTIEAFGLMNPCSDTYPNGSDICIFYTPLGAEGVVPYENEFGIFPGPGLRFMALLGRIGDGEPFYIGKGGTFTAEQDGTLWFTPNDNLRTDNQGAYGVLVWFGP